MNNTAQGLLRVSHALQYSPPTSPAPFNSLDLSPSSLYPLFFPPLPQPTVPKIHSDMSLSLPINPNTTSPVEDNFSSFYEAWLKQLEIHLQDLVLGRQPNHDTIVATLIAHHKDFYTAKWAAAHDDILAFFSPPWASPLESAFTWVTGWKPSTAFRLIDSLRKTRAPLTSLAQLTDEQARKIGELGVKIKLEEQRVERELERQQVAMGDLQMVELARLSSRADVNESSRVSGLISVAVKGKLEGLEKVMKMGDYVRLKTLKGVLDVLSPRQGVDFLAVFAMIQIQIRKWGKQRAAITNNLTFNTSLNLAYQVT